MLGPRLLAGGGYPSDGCCALATTAVGAYLGIALARALLALRQDA